MIPDLQVINDVAWNVTSRKKHRNAALRKFKNPENLPGRSVTSTLETFGRLAGYPAFRRHNPRCSRVASVNALFSVASNGSANEITMLI